MGHLGVGIDILGLAAADSVNEAAKRAAGRDLDRGAGELLTFAAATREKLAVADHAFGREIFVGHLIRQLGFFADQPADFEHQQRVAVVVHRQLRVGRLALVLVGEPSAQAPHALGQRAALDRPTGDVHFVYALVADVAVARVPEPMPVVRREIRLIRPLRRGPQPDVEIEACGRGLRLGHANRPAGFAAIALGDQQLAVFAGLHGRDFGRPILAAALLRAVLHDAAIFGRRFDALAALEHVVADRLFDVHVLASLASPDRNQRMPMVARGHGDDVQVLVVQRRANVGHALRTVSRRLVDHRLPRSEQPRIGVDQVRDLHVLVLQSAGKSVDVRSPPAVDASHAHANRVVRAQHAARGLGAGDGEQPKRSAGGGRRLNERTARNSSHDESAPCLWEGLPCLWEGLPSSLGGSSLHAGGRKYLRHPIVMHRREGNQQVGRRGSVETV